MKKTSFTFILLLNFTFCISQANTIKILYVIDSVPMYNGFNHFGQDDIIDNDIFSIQSKKDEFTLKKYPKYNLDEVIYILTKKYNKRPDSIKKIPTRNNMRMRNNLLYLKNSSMPYTGKYIDYFVDGHKQSEGYINYGLIDKMNKEFHKNGKVRKENNFRNGVQIGQERMFYSTGKIYSIKEFENNNFNGDWKFYFPNGQLKKVSTFDKGKIIGESITYNSKGEIDYVEVYKSGQLKKTSQSNKTINLYNKGIEAFSKNKLNEANETFTKVLSKDPKHLNSLKWLGKTLMKQSKFEESNQKFTSAIEIEPYLAELYLLRALANFELKEEKLNEKICSDLQKYFDYSTTFDSEATKVQRKICN